MTFEMRLLLLLVFMFPIFCEAEDCNIIKVKSEIRNEKYTGVKICGEKIYFRNYSCDNDLFEKNVKKYREQGNLLKLKHSLDFDTAINDWAKLSKFLKENNTCEPAWDLNEYYKAKDYTRSDRICDDWGGCFAEVYYDMTTGEKFSTRYEIEKAERPGSQGGYGGKAYALGSLDLQLSLGTASRKKPTKKEIKHVNRCLAKFNTNTQNRREHLRKCIKGKK